LHYNKIFIVSTDLYIGLSKLKKYKVYKMFSKILLRRYEPIADKCIDEYQDGFRKGKSPTNQLPTIGQTAEKKY